MEEVLESAYKNGRLTRRSLAECKERGTCTFSGTRVICRLDMS